MSESFVFYFVVLKLGVGWAGIGGWLCWGLGAGAGWAGAGLCGWGGGAGLGLQGGLGVLGGAVSCGAWILGNWAGISSHTFNENSKLMKMQLKAKFAQFLFILLLRV